MKVLYDYQAFCWQKYGGVSNCFAQLISCLPPTVNYDIGIVETDNVHLLDKHIANVLPYYKQPAESFITRRNFRGKYHLYDWCSKLLPWTTSFGRNRHRSIELLESGDYDVFHPTFFDGYFLNHLHGKPFVLTIHDMIPELVYEHKDDPQVAAKKKLAQKAAHIIAVSEQTKHDVMDVLKISESRISVVYHGAPEDKPYGKKPLFDFKYLLFVGGRNLPYKNFLPMVKSLAPVLQANQQLRLVCTGSDFTPDENALFARLGITDRVVHRYCSDSELMTLYHNAECFIFPSLYEGFGIPILEAWQAECPVLLNRKSCFPEIAGDAAIYFTLDKQTSDLAKVLTDFLESSNKERKVLIDKQLVRRGGTRGASRRSCWPTYIIR